MTRRRTALALVALMLGLLVLATLGATAERGPVAVPEAGRTAEPRPQPTTREKYSEPDWATYEAVPPEPPSDAPRAVLTLVVVIAVLVLLALALVLVIRMRALARPPLEEAEDVPEEPLTPEQARTALDAARTRLSTDLSAHDAVVAAWLALEQAIAAAGISRAPSRTTLEFVVEVLGGLDLEPRALEDLAALYRRALFDDHPLGEDDRARARALLEVLAAQREERAR